jgi:hypothetical protein
VAVPARENARMPATTRLWAERRSSDAVIFTVDPPSGALTSGRIGSLLIVDNTDIWNIIVSHEKHGS